jgi:hypothetical protein
MRSVSSVPDGEDEAFGVAGRSRTSWWDLHDVDPGSGQEIRFRLIAQSTWKKSAASMVETCARRNRRHDVRWTAAVPAGFAAA